MELKERKINGFDLEAMDQSMSAIRNKPEMAKFKFRAAKKWESGVRNESHIQDFYGVNKEDTSRKEPFIFKTDTPSRLNSSNTTYMEWLSDGVPNDVAKLCKRFVKVHIPDHKVDTIIGKSLYQSKCQLCHSEKGEGRKRDESEFTGYTYPPVAGFDTFNDGAGMTRVIIAAQFIEGNMPFGATCDAPQVMDEQAFHIATYISSLPRLSKANKRKDFLNIKLKPVSVAYGPWADEFSVERHKFGPFPPIISHYKERFDLTMTR